MNILKELYYSDNEKSEEYISNCRKLIDDKNEYLLKITEEINKEKSNIIKDFCNSLLEDFNFLNYFINTNLYNISTILTICLLYDLGYLEIITERYKETIDNYTDFIYESNFEKEYQEVACFINKLLDDDDFENSFRANVFNNKIRLLNNDESELDIIIRSEDFENETYAYSMNQDYDILYKRILSESVKNIGILKNRLENEKQY